MKFISNSFFSVSELDKWRKLIAFFHDLGKATDFFQFKIIKAALSKEGNEDFIENNRSYIDDFLTDEIL